MDARPSPLYATLLESGVLEKRACEAKSLLSNCQMCPRACGVNRTNAETGFCRTALLARVASAGPHFGEESPLVGRRGSGTIFFAGCNLACVYCQNWDISQSDFGTELDARSLAELMLSLQRSGCHNINLVSPSHVIPQILEALCYAAPRGLNLPLVYNSGGYDRVSSLLLLESVVDIYMPDFKYADPEVAKRLSDAPDYPEVARDAILEMHRQVGDLAVHNNTASRGLIVRHLVLPEGLAGTREIAHFIAKDISPDTYVNIMDQYYPAHKARRYPPLNRRLSSAEYRKALEAARQEGLRRFAR